MLSCFYSINKLTHTRTRIMFCTEVRLHFCGMRKELKREEKAHGSFVRCFALGHSERVCECVILSYKLLTNAPNDKFLYQIPIENVFGDRFICGPCIVCVCRDQFSFCGAVFHPKLLLDYFTMIICDRQQCQWSHLISCGECVVVRWFLWTRHVIPLCHMTSGRMADKME